MNFLDYPIMIYIKLLSDNFNLNYKTIENYYINKLKKIYKFNYNQTMNGIENMYIDRLNNFYFLINKNLAVKIITENLILN